MYSKDEFTDWLNRTLSKRNQLEDFIQTHNSQGGGYKTCLYGAGHACEFYIRFFKKNNVRMEAIIDEDVNKQGKEYFGVPVKGLETILGCYGDADLDIVIAVPSLYKTIQEQLSKTISNSHIYYFDVEQYEYYDNSSKKVKEYLLANVDGLYDIYTLWEDEKSRDVMLKVIEARYTCDLDVISGIWEKNQYWPSNLIEFNDKEVVVESGSFDGKTLVELLERLNRKYKKIYCFEPDKQCRPILEEVIKNNKGEGDIVLVPKGTYSEETILHFSSDSIDSGLSCVDEDGSIEIPVTTIDSVVENDVTYIKMDIEGSELDSLRGACNTISNCKPKLAICVYHKNEDMTEIPSYIKSLRNDYKFYLRHHNCNVTETVLYAL